MHDTAKPPKAEFAHQTEAVKNLRMRRKQYPTFIKTKAVTVNITEYLVVMLYNVTLK